MTARQLDQTGQIDHNLSMVTVVGAGEAKAKLSDLLRRAEAGEEIVVTRNGEPVAKLIPIRPRVGGFMRGEITEKTPNWWHADDDLATLFGQ